MSYSETLKQTQAILDEIRKQQASLGQPTSPIGIEAVEKVLRDLINAQPDSIECAVRSRQVAFVRTSRTSQARDLEAQLQLNKALCVTHRTPHIVQFWPVGTAAQLFKVTQETPFKKDIGEVYALNGSDARDLLAANANFVAHEPGTVVTVHGRQVKVPGKALFDADRAYFRACKAVVAGSIELPQSWTSTAINP